MNERFLIPRSHRITESCLHWRSSWSFLVVAICFCVASVDAAELAAGPPSRIEPESEVPAGPCVLLHNGNVLFGTASKIGDNVHVTRDSQSTVTLSGDKVACIGQSLQQLYEFRRENRFGVDLKRIQADVRWCLQNGLVRLAAEDVLLARQLDPWNPQTLQLLRQVAARMKQQSTDHQPGNQRLPSDVRTVSHDSAIDSATDDSATDDSAADEDDHRPVLVSPLPDDLTFQFTSRIQPILMNRCAGCHVRGPTSEREFQIHPALKSKWAPKTVAIQNLQAVMNYVNRNQPEMSMIRLRATDGHGGNRRSFGKPDSSMMRNLDFWLSRIQPSGQDWPVQQTSGIMPNPTGRSLEPTEPPKLGPIDFDSMHLQQVTAAKTITPNTQPGNQAGNQAGTGIPNLPTPIESVANGSPAEPSSNAPLRTRRLPKVQNPFDPEIFNRRFHGQ